MRPAAAAAGCCCFTQALCGTLEPFGATVLTGPQGAFNGKSNFDFWVKQNDRGTPKMWLTLQAADGKVRWLVAVCKQGLGCSWHASRGACCVPPARTQHGRLTARAPTAMAAFTSCLGLLRQSLTLFMCRAALVAPGRL